MTPFVGQPMYRQHEHTHVGWFVCTRTRTHMHTHAHTCLLIYRHDSLCFFKNCSSPPLEAFQTTKWSNFWDVLGVNWNQWYAWKILSSEPGRSLRWWHMKKPVFASQGHMLHRFRVWFPHGSFPSTFDFFVYIHLKMCTFVYLVVLYCCGCSI